ncbi:TadE/TadG family type IV pilus assembly protein [Ciceribacter selenitireducens]|uniref:TadE/TadG family type IV pilus assembly protein n=1 Tax=Ciceribacter selenitireducens TaxID=448181 RepID=UPI001F475922|nr:TadE/TadG family type IV pilus assembly protein [Ciceribacter selenitireducens]
MSAPSQPLGRDADRSRKGYLSRLTSVLRRMRDDRSGIGGVEFALIAPLLLVLYLAAFELTLAFNTSKRATVSASTVADLVSRADKVVKNDLDDMVDVVSAIFAPYDPYKLALNITGVKVDSSKAASVAWSWSNSGSAPYAVGATVPVPADMLEADIFLIRTELTVSHELLMYLPALSGSTIRELTISREFYFRQRVNTDITCGDC